MAKRTVKKKGRDIPPLYVVVGFEPKIALYPAFQHDQERIGSFRPNTRLICTIETESNRRGVRKWYAIIGKAVKADLLPWKTQTAADEAIRLLLDMFTPVKAKDGSWHQVTMSLNDLEDEELDDYIELLQALIVRYSGVDPSDFQRELAGAGDEQFGSDYDNPVSIAPDADNTGAAESVVSPSDSATISPDDAPSPQPQSSGGAPAAAEPVSPSEDSSGPSNSSQAEEPVNNGAGNPSADGEEGGPVSLATDPSPSTDPELTQAATALAEQFNLPDHERVWLRESTRRMVACVINPEKFEAKDPTTWDLMVRTARSILMEAPPRVSQEAQTRFERAKQHTIDVWRKETPIKWEFLAEQALTTVAGVTPARPKGV